MSSQSDSVKLAIASRSPAMTALKGSLFFHSGCLGASSRTRSSANMACVYSGCDTQSVPSWSKVAIRSSGSTYLGPDLWVTSLTNDKIACFVEPSFQEGG